MRRKSVTINRGQKIITEEYKEQFLNDYVEVTSQSAITCSKVTIETLE